MLLVHGCFLLGCSRSNRLATYPVHGTLTYKGKPVAGATVDFLAPGAPRPAVGNTDQAGHFRLTTFEPDDGAIAGKHVVIVLKSDYQPAANTAQVENDPAAIERAMLQSAIQQRRGKSLVPAKYADRKTTDLRIEVAPHENEVELNLVD